MWITFLKYHLFFVAITLRWHVLFAMTTLQGKRWHHSPEDEIMSRSSTWLIKPQFSSVTQSCPTLCASMNRSTPGLPVHHQLPEFIQTHIHQVSDAIQPSHPRSSPSPPATNPSQHQSFPMSQIFAWGDQSTGVSALASFLPQKSQVWSPSEWTGWISLQSKGLSRVFSKTLYLRENFP